MPSSFVVGGRADASTRILSVPLGALRVGPADLVRVADKLPASAVRIGSRGLILAATPCAYPMFDNLEAIAARHQCDVMLVRTGLFPETMDPVTVDVALYTGLETVSLIDLHFCRRSDGSLWLVGEPNQPTVQIGQRGLALCMEWPFVTGHERVEAACSAAAEIVRIATNGRVR